MNLKPRKNYLPQNPKRNDIPSAVGALYESESKDEAYDAAYDGSVVSLGD